MAIPIPDHTCSYYCTGQQHAIPSLATKEQTMQFALMDLSVAAALFG